MKQEYSTHEIEVGIDEAGRGSLFGRDEKTIDKMNILQATIHGMHKTINGLKIKPEKLLVDGNYFKPYFIN